jgi:hypothetical protein
MTKTIELLYFDGCPNHEPVLARMPELLARAGVDAKLELRHVESDEDAQRSRFLGSPTVRVGGRDVEPGADEREDFGLKCRLYRTSAGLGGVPLDEWIVAALQGEASGGQPLLGEAVLGGQFAKTRLKGASEAARAMHRSVITSFIAGHAPEATDLGRWAEELGVDGDAALAELESRDLVWRDAATGAVAVAYPFSGRATSHRIRIGDNDRDVFAMCAIDALGIAALAGQPVEVRSEEAAAGEPVRVHLEPEGGAEADPENLAVVVGRTGDGPSASTCCPYLNFVADRDRAEALLAATPGLQGTVLELPDAVALGRELFGGLLDKGDA